MEQETAATLYSAGGVGGDGGGQQARRRSRAGINLRGRRVMQRIACMPPIVYACFSAAWRSAQAVRLLSGRACRPTTSMAVAAPKVKYLRRGAFGGDHGMQLCRWRYPSRAGSSRRRARQALGLPAPPVSPGTLPRLPRAGLAGRGRGFAKQVAAGLVLALRKEAAAAASPRLAAPPGSQRQPAEEQRHGRASACARRCGAAIGREAPDSAADVNTRQGMKCSAQRRA